MENSPSLNEEGDSDWSTDEEEVRDWLTGDDDNDRWTGFQQISDWSSDEDVDTDWLTDDDNQTAIHDENGEHLYFHIMNKLIIKYEPGMTIIIIRRFYYLVCRSMKSVSVIVA